MNAKERKTLKKLSGANFAFFVCEQFLAKGNKFDDENNIVFSGSEYKYTDENMTYVIEKFFYESKYFQTHIDVAEMVAKYRYIFLLELTSKELEEKELEEEEEEEEEEVEEDTISILVKELAK